MQRFRRAISFRRSQRHIPESCRPHQWESDSHKVKSGGISFAVKYLGAQEVSESRGTQICSEAAKILKKNKRRRRSRKMTLLVTEDCIRVVDDKTKQLVIDQTIEKVSFCSPDPYNEKLFCYISRDGTSRRWMCQCFSARHDTGERLSHAVGCAFTACLQRKQKQVALKEQHFERQASVRQPSNKDKALEQSSGTSVQSTSVQPPGSPSAPADVVPETPSVSSDQGSPTASISSTTIQPITPPAVSEPVENQPIRKKEKKLHLQSRPRPQGVNANPFTRHTSLRYRSQPLSLQPLKPGKYEVLTDDQSVLPRLPPSPPTPTPPATQPQKPTDLDAILSMQGPAATTNTWNNANGGTAGQAAVPNQWSSTTGGNSAGLLMASENSRAVVQSNSWSNELKMQPANKQENPFQVNGDEFGNLATRHQNTEGKGNNPFKTQEPVHWL